MIPLTITKQMNDTFYYYKQMNDTGYYYEINQQGNRWKRGMLPKCLLSIKGRSCNQTPPVN